jgi:hypothetical protein
VVRKLAGPVVPLSNTGSFACVRFSAHCAQDNGLLGVARDLRLAADG